MSIVIVDTGVANRHSIRNALEHIGCDVVLSADAAAISDAGKLVFPGVGAFAAGMRSLQARGLVEVLQREVVERGKPILGICLGMQMMAGVGEEDGEHPGLGWLTGRVRRLTPDNSRLKVPHIGFNTVMSKPGARLFAGLPDAADFYFVHSYFVDTTAEVVSATADHGGAFAAAVERDNIMGVQFHPEKSQAAGLQLLRNFVNLA